MFVLAFKGERAVSFNIKCTRGGMKVGRRNYGGVEPNDRLYNKGCKRVAWRVERGKDTSIKKPSGGVGLRS